MKNNLKFIVVASIGFALVIAGEVFPHQALTTVGGVLAFLGVIGAIVSNYTK